MNMELVAKVNRTKAIIRDFLKTEGYTEEVKKFSPVRYNEFERFYKLDGEFETCVSLNLEKLEVFTRYIRLPSESPGSSIIFELAGLVSINVDPSVIWEYVTDAVQDNITTLSAMYGVVNK